MQDRDTCSKASKLETQVKLLASENERLIGLKKQGMFISEIQIQ